MDGRLLVSLFCLSLLCPEALVSAEFILTVNFIDYTNPTGLCAECETRLENLTSADQLVPVCCDESPSTSVNCDNTGEARCDTRFRWTIRPFGASLETRPVSVPGAAIPPYYFTDCDLPNATCPFSEMSTTFSQGPTGFLGVAANPLPVEPRNMASWTGKVQFFIEALDSGLPNIIDSLLINLDTLQLGADFTEEMTFTGYHNISHMTMSFRVECAPGFCGRDCTLTVNNFNEFMRSCQTNGELVCVSGRDPDTNCSDCLSGRNITTNCTTCLPGFSGENCVPDFPEVVGAVVGGVVGVAILAVIVGVAVVLVVIFVRRSHKPSHQAKAAVNHSYESTEPATLRGDLSLKKKSSTGVSTQEYDFNNPLYATTNTENDYSSPWDTRQAGSNKPLVVASSISTHAVAMRVNSNEPGVGGSKKSSVRNKQVEYADIDTTVKIPRAPKPRPPQATYDYANPPNTPPQPVYDSADYPPQVMATPTSQHNAKSADVKVVAYEYNALPGFSANKDERTFDNTGENGLYRSYSPTELPSLAQQHYDLGK